MIGFKSTAASNISDSQVIRRSKKNGVNSNNGIFRGPASIIPKEGVFNNFELGLKQKMPVFIFAKMPNFAKFRENRSKIFTVEKMFATSTTFLLFSRKIWENNLIFKETAIF
jgi:hypothetical protein